MLRTIGFPALLLATVCWACARPASCSITDVRWPALATGTAPAAEPAGSADTPQPQAAPPAGETKPDDFTVEALIFDDNSTLATIDRSARIKRLVLSGQGVTNVGLAHLNGLGKVGTLSIERTKITDSGLSLLVGLKDVRSLRLWQSSFTNSALDRVKVLTSLESLDLEGTQIHGEALTRLKGLSNLRKLVLGRESQDQDLEYLKGLPGLEEIDLRGCHRITDAGLVNLAELPNLRALWLPESITDAGLRHVSRLTRLQRLWLPEQISSAVKKQIEQQLPNCVLLPTEAKAGSVEEAAGVPAAKTE